MKHLVGLTVLLCAFAQSTTLRGAENKSVIYSPGTAVSRPGAPISLRPGPHLFLDEFLIESSSNYGIGYTTLAWSHDGEHWVRDREPFFDRSSQRGAWDRAHAWIDEQVPVGDEVYL